MFETNPLEVTGLILFAVSWLLLAFSMYAFRFFPVLKKESPEKSVQNRVAVVICAHNEESVIADLLTALQKQTRPADKVYVIADNCSDDTAAIAGRMGAVVFEKKQTAGGGKADALFQINRTVINMKKEKLQNLSLGKMPSPGAERKISYGSFTLIELVEIKKITSRFSGL